MNWPLVIASGMSLVGAAIHGIVGDLFLRKVARRSVALDEVSEAFKPADLPAEQASRYQPVINLKTTKALGLAIPESCCAAAR